MKRMTILTAVMFFAAHSVLAQQPVAAHSAPQKPKVTEKGVKSDTPAPVLSLFLDRIASDEDYKALCYALINKEQMMNTIELYKKNGSAFMILDLVPEPEKRQEYYSKLKGENVPFPENHYILGIIQIVRSDRNNPIKDMGIYAVLSHDVTNGSYWIVEFGVDNSK